MTGRPNRSGIDWSDPEERKERMRENTRKWKNQGGKKQKPPIVIEGVEYPSIRAAAEARGVSYQAIWLRLHPEVHRRQKERDRRRRGVSLKGIASKRWVRLKKEDMLLAHRLLPLFPDCTDIDSLFAYALRKLAETTDD